VPQGYSFVTGEAVCSGEVDCLLNYFIDETWSYLNGHMNNQNNTYYWVDIPRVIHGMKLEYDVPSV
jgi:hypothetical protein